MADLNTNDYIVTMVTRGEMAPVEAVSPDRVQGVQRVSKHVRSPSLLKNGQSGLLWKKQKTGADPSTSSPEPKCGTLRTLEELLNSQDESLLNKVVAAKLKVMLGGMRESDWANMMDLNTKNFLRNISKQFHLKIKASGNSQWINAYNDSLKAARAAGVLTNHHKASHSSTFNIEVRNCLKECEDPAKAQEAGKRLAIAAETIDASTELPGLGQAYIALEKAYGAFNEDLHEPITPEFINEAKELASDGRFEKFGDKVTSLVLTMLAKLSSN